VSLTRTQLIERFHGYGNPNQLIGGEFERILVRRDGGPVGYSEPHGIRWILEQLQERFGWTPVFEGEHLIALTRDGASTTLEPGGQVELSGAPHASLRDVVGEALTSMSELKVLAAEGDLFLVALGLTPYPPMTDIPWVPKGRYGVMRSYLGEIGDMAHVMMKGTSSFQANFDYRDEADCGRKAGTMAKLGPLTTALFANSPLLAGQPTGYASTRGLAWTRTDPARTGFPQVLADDYTHEAWVDYLLDAPMMFYKRDGAWAHAEGRTFRTYMDRGFEGNFPTWQDWELHETSVFPEVRVKRAIEIRGADAVPLPLAFAGIAMWTGLLYDDVALDGAAQLAAEFASHGNATERFDQAVRFGLRGQVGDRTMAEWAADLTALAAAGLGRHAPSDLALLEPVEALVAHGESPGDAVLRIWKECQAGDKRPCFLKRVLY
jgi:glutamate--cysteine ligase